MTPQTPSLLIVDDSRMSRMLIRGIIQSERPDWQFYEASSGEEGVRLAQEHQPTYITMDVNMPGMSGLEAAGRIRIHLPHTKIALCTANIQESTRDAAHRVGLHFVAKPITPQSMEDAIRFFEGA